MPEFQLKGYSCKLTQFDLFVLYHRNLKDNLLKILSNGILFREFAWAAEAFMKILFYDLLLQGSKKNGVWCACGLYDNTDDFLFFSVAFSISSSPICCLSVNLQMHEWLLILICDFSFLGALLLAVYTLFPTIYC